LNNLDVWSFALQLATLVAVLVAARQLVFQSRQMHRDFEALYVQRYWALMDRRSRRFALGGGLSRDDRITVRNYIQLCEDQIDCRRIGRVTDSTWVFWRGAIADQLQQPAYRTELDELSGETFPRVRELLNNPGQHDPLGWWWVWRKAQGL
jgi:hypothetical protein